MSSQICKVRFAPSPTGYMHVGNARIAIINYLFCKKNNGHFLFRLDDTDLERSKKEYEDGILRDLAWLGIEYDSTFRQSDRIERYEEVKHQLIEKGLIYKCYETQEELEYKRKLAIAKGKPPVYDRASLNLSNEKMIELENSGVPFYFRFKLPHKVVSWNDMIMGHVSYDLSNISDPVIVKADGAFLYTFTSVVDDIDSEITHIIRGQDHTTNTAVHIAMFDVISNGEYHVDFAHLSLLVNKDGSQFSKRLGSLNLEDIRKDGVDSMSIVSLLSTLGSSQDIVPCTSMQDVIDNFDITKFSTNSPKFDIEDIFKLNKKILHKYSYKEILNRIGENEYIEENIFNIVHENIDKLSDFKMWTNIFSNEYKVDYKFNDVESDVIKTAIAAIDKYGLENWIQEVINAKSGSNLSKKDIYMPIRIALTGLPHGPNIIEIAKLLGLDEVKRRLSL